MARALSSAGLGNARQLSTCGYFRRGVGTFPRFDLVLLLAILANFRCQLRRAVAVYAGMNSALSGVRAASPSGRGDCGLKSLASERHRSSRIHASSLINIPLIPLSCSSISDVWLR